MNAPIRANSTLTRLSYYKEKFGLEFKAVLDSILETIATSKTTFIVKVYQYKDFPEFTPATIYARINQSRMYLIDKMDPEGKYKQLLENIQITRDPNLGVIITYREPLKIAPVEPPSIEL